MNKEDIVEVHAISQQSFSTPWQQNSFEYEISNKDAILNVAVLDSEIIGYVCLRTILDVTHVLDIAVLPGLRQSGIGSTLLRSAIQDLRRLKNDARTVTLEVRESNIAAIRLYEKFGFKEIGRRNGYYKKPNEDAILMELDMAVKNPSLTFH